jgi:hypothetical protein
MTLPSKMPSQSKSGEDDPRRYAVFFNSDIDGIDEVTFYNEGGQYTSPVSNGYSYANSSVPSTNYSGIAFYVNGVTKKPLVAIETNMFQLPHDKHGEGEIWCTWVQQATCTESIRDWKALVVTSNGDYPCQDGPYTVTSGNCTYNLSPKTQVLYDVLPEYHVFFFQNWNYGDGYVLLQSRF